MLLFHTSSTHENQDQTAKDHCTEREAEENFFPRTDVPKTEKKLTWRHLLYHNITDQILQQARSEEKPLALPHVPSPSLNVIKV